MGKTKPFALFYALLRLTDRSRMSGDAHVRFFEGLGVKFPGATLQVRLGTDKSGLNARSMICSYFVST